MGYGYALTVRDMETLLDDAGRYQWDSPGPRLLARASQAGCQECWTESHAQIVGQHGLALDLPVCESELAER